MPENTPADNDKNRSTTSAEYQKWLEENAAAFKAQSEWHRTHGHPLVDIMVSPAAETWRE
ncbi:hypothetical protein [Marivita sp. S6314]|uniref:hypothetical protein n=1 Tax=Marivita sp. S6314 TaxID=2926406 RepID=UPI001FF5082E|nr:hypothetical protein [Marivita sp. S6314]